MAQPQKRKAEGEVGADATTPKEGAKQMRIREMLALNYIETTSENLQDVRGMVDEQLKKSSDQKLDSWFSEEDWWSDAKDWIKNRDMCDKRFLVIVQENKTGHLIGFNAYECKDAKTTCHLLYVHTDYRQNGIASEMLKQSGIRYAFSLAEALPFWQTWAERNNCTFQPGSSFMEPKADRDA